MYLITNAKTFTTINMGKSPYRDATLPYDCFDNETQFTCCHCNLFVNIYGIIINLLSWRIFPASRGWPVLSPLSSSNPPIPCILLHYSPLFHVFLYHINPSFHWPASLSPSFYFQLQHFLYLHLLISSCNMSKPPQSFLPQMLL